MATLATNVSFQCFGLDGKPLAGGKVYTYSAGTTTSKATYTTMAGTVANPNPVILDQNGKAKIFLSDGSYRLQIKDSNDALIDDIDQISRYVTQSEFATFQQTVNDGVSQLTEVREQIDVFVNASIGNQKGFANGIAPLDANVKVDPIYLPDLPNNATPQATETAFGVAKIATTAIAQAGTNDTDIITPAKLKGYLDNKVLGINQTWQDVTTSRSSATTYTNSSTAPIMLSIAVRDGDGGGGGVILYVNGFIAIRLADLSGGSAGYSQIVAIVPAGKTYRLDASNNPITFWGELK